MNYEVLGIIGAALKPKICVTFYDPTPPPIKKLDVLINGIAPLCPLGVTPLEL